MSVKYSKTIVSKIIGEDEDAVKYKASKLGAYELSLEGMKIVKMLMPAMGVGIDSVTDELGLESGSTGAHIMFAISDRFTPEHYTELVDKLLGSLFVGEKKVEDWSEHFDEHPEHFFEVLGWLFKENFYSFFLKSTILAPWMSKIQTLLPSIEEKIMSVLNNKEPESNEELSKEI